MSGMIRGVFAGALLGGLLAGIGALPASADETCNSPYMGNLIKGQEDYLYVWALGVKGMGDGSDKLVTIDVNPSSSRYGKVLNKLSVRGRGEAHHMGFTDDRRYLWAGGLDSSRISIFDVGTDPARPKLVRTISDMPAKTGYVGPHTFYAMPGRMIVQGLSNTKDGGGVTGMAHRVSDDRDLRDRVRLVSLSFDPARDKPAVMRRYAAGAPPNGVEWAFLTTERARTLVPLLDGFGQDVRFERDAHGRPAGPLAHVLKVFLLDEGAVVREIYTTAYLFPEVIMNDIKTLWLADQPRRKAAP